MQSIGLRRLHIMKVENSNRFLKMEEIRIKPEGKAAIQQGLGVPFLGQLCRVWGGENPPSTASFAILSAGPKAQAQQSYRGLNSAQELFH